MCKDSFKNFTRFYKIHYFFHTYLPMSGASDLSFFQNVHNFSTYLLTHICRIYLLRHNFFNNSFHVPKPLQQFCSIRDTVIYFWPYRSRTAFSFLSISLTSHIYSNPTTFILAAYKGVQRSIHTISCGHSPFTIIRTIIK